MDDATQKLGTCPTCRHAEHEGHICLNMASDYDCGCDKRPAKVADDATQKLVDDARADAAALVNRRPHTARTLTALADALEAAQRPPVAGDEADAPAWVDRHGDVWIFRNGMGWSFETQPFTREHIEKKWGPLVPLAAQRPPVSGEYTHVVNLARASEAADKGLDALIDYLADLPTVEEWRPPVSPEQREAVRATVGAVLVNASNYPVPVAARVLGRDMSVVIDKTTDAILAWFSLPVLDVEKVAEAAQAEVNQAHPEWHDVGVGIVQGSHYRAGFVAGAKWAVASLHTLTTDGTPADTERNES